MGNLTITVSAAISRPSCVEDKAIQWAFIIARVFGPNRHETLEVTKRHPVEVRQLRGAEHIEFKTKEILPWRSA